MTRLSGRAVDDVALALYVALALVWTGPALLSGGNAVCAADAPDTWTHLWAFWRAWFAASGGDLGYLVSHALTFPAAAPEPLAVFDPLLSLMAVPLRAVGVEVAVIFNLLTAAGLVFTGLAGYALCAHLAGRRAPGLVGGTIMMAAPFLYRQLAGGYVEYAWWGVVPLTTWLYLRGLDRPSHGRYAAYAVSVLGMALMSIYCTAVFAAIALLSLGREAVRAVWRGPYRLLQALYLHGVAAALLLPLLILWAWSLAWFGFGSMPLGKPFPADAVGAIEAIAERPDADPDDLAQLFLPWRTLHGSLDLADLTDPARSWPEREETRRENGGPAAFFMGEARYAFFEAVYLREWLPVLLLAACALLWRRRLRALLWVAAAGVFLVFAFGPFPIFDGSPDTAVTLPYAWAYRWLPGFSRLNIPGRAFLGTMLCLGVLASFGLLGPQRRDGTAATGWCVAVSVALFAWFSVTGAGRLTLPTTPADVHPAYRHIARSARPGAVLELPSRGDIDRRMFAQSVHNRPIHGGVPPTFMPAPPDDSIVAENPLVASLDTEHPRPPPALARRAAAAALADLGFSHLVLHADGYSSEAAFAAAVRTAAGCLGPPMTGDRQIALWALEPARTDP